MNIILRHTLSSRFKTSTRGADGSGNVFTERSDIRRQAALNHQGRMQIGVGYGCCHSVGLERNQVIDTMGVGKSGDSGKTYVSAIASYNCPVRLRKGIK